MAHHVFLSAGHGGSDPGACAFGMCEKDITLDIMLACKGALERAGVRVTPSRMGDEDDPVQQEVAEANRCGAELAVSFHANAGGGDGSETFYWPTSASGKRLAEIVERHLVAIGQNSRGVKTNNLMFTRATKMTAVLSECAFIDNDRDNDIIDSAPERAAFGIAYAQAILEYLGVAGAPAAPAPAPQPAPKPQWSCRDLGDTAWTGPAMASEWQAQLGTKVDGCISGQNKYNADTVQWAITVSPACNPARGSSMVIALQKFLNARGFGVGPDGADGHMGKGTVKALQAFLNDRLGVGLAADGMYGHATSRAVGTALQRGLFR